MNNQYYIAKIFGINNSSYFFYVDNWHSETVLKKVDWNNHYGFQFETRRKTIEKTDYSYTVIPTIIEQSEMYYVNGYIETYDDIEARKDPEEYSLLTRMKKLKRDRIVKSLSDKNWWFFLNEGDKILNV